MENCLSAPLVSAEELALRVEELGREIAAYYAKLSEPLTLLALLKGSLYFAADLSRAIALPLHMEFLAVSSYYEGTTSSGTLEYGERLPDLRGRHLLLLDDILDTGLTLSALREKLLAETGALSIRTAVLLRKRKGQSAVADWIGFEIDDHFVVGYGLDHAQNYRNLPDIRILQST